MMRVKIHFQELQEFIRYLDDALHNDAKTTDALKEYLLARHIQNVLHKCKLVELKYQMAQHYKIKSIAVTDLELLALSNYFNRYQVHSYLLPLQYEFLETVPEHFPALVNVLANNPVWLQEFDN